MILINPIAIYVHRYNEEQNKPTICWFIGKLGALERGKTHPQNAASLLKFQQAFKWEKIF